MPDPTNPADLPASWLPGATEATPKPATYRRAVARKVKNARHAKVLAMTNVVEDWCRTTGVTPDNLDAVLSHMRPAWWKAVAQAAGHPCSKVTDETRTAVVDKLRRDLAEPYRAKGRG